MQKAVDEGVALEKMLLLPGEFQYESMLVDARNTEVHLLPGDLANHPDILADYSAMTLRIHTNYMQVTGKPQDAPFGNFLKWTSVVFSCVSENNFEKPPVADARAARNELIALAATPTTQAEFAKAATYKPGQVAMQSALVHSHIGIEDDATSTICCGCAESLEALLEPAFEDTESWLETGKDGERLDFKSLEVLLGSG